MIQNNCDYTIIYQAYPTAKILKQIIITFHKNNLKISFRMSDEDDKIFVMDINTFISPPGGFASRKGLLANVGYPLLKTQPGYVPSAWVNEFMFFWVVQAAGGLRPRVYLFLGVSVYKCDLIQFRVC